MRAFSSGGFDIAKSDIKLMAAVEEQRLKEIRRSLGMMQVQLAASAGISQNRVSDIENGRTTSLKIITLERVMRMRSDATSRSF